MEEIWKPVLGWEDAYEISCFGELRTVTRMILFGGAWKLRESFKCSLSYSPEGYPKYSLNYNGRSKNILIHRLVAIAFIPNPENKKCVNHIDGNKFNNHVKNLEWCTYSENTKHSYRLGLQVPIHGEKNHRTLISDSDAMEIYKLVSENNLTRKEIAASYGISYHNINTIISGKSRKHLNMPKLKIDRREFFGFQSKETMDRIWELHKMGFSTYKIGEDVGVNSSTVWRLLQKLKSKNNLK